MFLPPKLLRFNVYIIPRTYLIGKTIIFYLPNFNLPLLDAASENDTTATVVKKMI